MAEYPEKCPCVGDDEAYEQCAAASGGETEVPCAFPDFYAANPDIAPPEEE